MTLEHPDPDGELMTRGLGGQTSPRTTTSPVRNCKRIIEAAVQDMACSDRAAVKEPVEGVSTFSKTFPQRGARDSQGPQSEGLDLHTRLFALIR